MTQIPKESVGRRKWQRIGLVIGGVTLLLCALCIGLSIWSSQMQQHPTEGTSTRASQTRQRSSFPASTASPTPKTTASAPPTVSPITKSAVIPTFTALPALTKTLSPAITPHPDAMVNVNALNLRAGPGTQ